jgi:glycosyltransferase involved in cell wall biosynthesis
MKKHSILIINRVYPPHRGATGRMAENLARYLVAQGWDVSVLTTGEKASNHLEKDVFVHRVKAKQEPAGFFSYAFIGLKMVLKAFFLKRTDVVITMTDPPLCAHIGNLYAKLKKAKHVHWSQDIYPDLLPMMDKRLPTWLHHFIYKRSRKVMNKAARVVSIGRCMSVYLAKTGVTKNKIVTISNWSDPQIFIPEEKGKPLMQAQAQLPEKMFRDDSPKFRILYAGNIGLAHDIQTIVDAAKILQEHKEIEIVFIGTSKAHEALAAERSKEGLDNIKFMPYQPAHSLKNVLESGDIHLAAMRPEMGGLLVPCKFYGGLAVGRPTIFVGSEASEIGQVLADYKAGITVTDNDAQKLADAILHYRHDGQAWFEAQEGALAASQVYNAHVSLGQWQEELEKVLSLK